MKGLDHPLLHETWQDGQKRHVSSESGDLADVGFHALHVDAIRNAYGNSRLWAVGGRLWDELDDLGFITSRIFHADDLDGFPTAKDRPESMRVSVRPGEHVDVALYLCRPGAATEGFIAEERVDPDVQVRVLDNWTPWLVVTARVMRPLTSEG